LRYNSVLFDLDGTLVDSSEGIRNAFRYALQKLGRKDWNGKLPDDFIGPPLRATFMSFYGMDAAQTEEAVRLYREYYQPTGIYQCSVYPYAEEMLERISRAGMGIYLATSKARVFAETVLNHWNLMRYFDGVAGSGLDGSMDSKAEVIRHLLDGRIKSGHLPAVMAGDRWHDAKGAQDCGMDLVAALWGFGSREEFLPYSNVKGLFNDAKELCDWLLEEEGS
jgi:phosphoglycolate phosphatase